MRLIIVNGFLGSGKTTFIQRFLSTQTDLIPVIVNEFGKTSYDGDLIGSNHTMVTSIHHGSIFCTCKAEEFVSVLSDVLLKYKDLCLIESSGFADPSSMDGLVTRAMHLASVSEVEVCGISIVDPLTFKKLIGPMAMIRKQIETADTILINKADSCDVETIEELAKLVGVFNKTAKIIHGSNGVIDEDALAFRRLVTTNLIDYGTKKDDTIREITLTCKTWSNYESISGFLKEIEPLLLRLKGYVHTTEKAHRIEIAGGLHKIEVVKTSNDKVVFLYSTKFASSKKLLETLEKYLLEYERGT